MLVGLCNEVIAELPFERQCEVAAQLGYDGLELSPFTVDAEPHLLPSAKRTALRRAAEDAGIVITGLHYLMRAPAGLSITARDAAQRARTIGVMRDLCGLAAELGGKVLVHGSPDQRKLEPGFEDEGRKHAIECFAAAADAAASAGVVYCVEPLSRRQTDHINTIAEAVAIVTTIGNPALRTMLDCSSAGATETESIPDAIRRWLPTGLIAHVHLNDPNRRGPGEGDLAFAPIFAALRDQNYAGDFGIEPFVYVPDGPTCAARAIGYVRGLMEASPR
ncbi:MAG: sugar phosphate isomerase/epimerase family protein [Pseudolabrys sp.]|nr:sugar phosphate isomerase/epimerase family protein [Pseudolabrys sp.]MDP2294017.1 sugar phosphate isomerase/epimerase family protein [Pseudolabrys sp.]